MLGSYNSAVLAYHRYRNIHTGFLLLDQVMVQKSDSHKGTEKKVLLQIIRLYLCIHTS